MPARYPAATLPSIRHAKMRYTDLCSVKEPLVSVITPSLTHAKFLRATQAIVVLFAGMTFP